MSEDVRARHGLIGPNAILQLLPFLDHIGGPKGRTALLERAGLFGVPDGSCMIPETDAARLHRQLRRDEPELAPFLCYWAGRATAEYILSNRIPRPAQLLLRLLPAGPSAHLLSRAISQHAWTFAGSGTFRAVTPTVFEITANPLVRGELSKSCLCDWHVGVFDRLYEELVAPDYTCVETSCCAQKGDNVCRFEFARSGQMKSKFKI